MGLTGCTTEDESIGSVGHAVTSLGFEHDVITDSAPLYNLSTVWIPTGDSSGRILTAYTAGETPIAKYAYTDPQTWISGTTNQVDQPWNGVSPWPAPENLCELYGGCASGTTAFMGYVGAAVALSTDHLNTAAIVAVSHTDDNGFDSYDVVVVTSIDGGQTFTNARIISTGLSGQSERPAVDRIDATTIISTKTATERDRDSTAANIVVWRGGLETPAGWWATKVLVDPSDGHVVLLQDPTALGFAPERTGYVTVRAWEEEADGLETIAFAWSERFDREGTAYGPYDELPSCPSDERAMITWHYWRATGFFDHNSSVIANWVEQLSFVDEDRAFRPCVGPSHSSNPAASPFYVNSDRPDLAVQRRPGIAIMTYAMTDPVSDKSHIFTANLNVWAATTGYVPSISYEEMVPPAGDEEYNPKTVIGQGRTRTASDISQPGPFSTEYPIFAMVRKRVSGTAVSVIGRTESWDICDVEDSWCAWGGSFNFWQQPHQVTLSTGATPSFDGTTLGMAVQPICIFDDYGPCVTGGLIARRFHATYPRLHLGAVRGLGYEH